MSRTGDENIALFQTVDYTIFLSPKKFLIFSSDDVEEANSIKEHYKNILNKNIVKFYKSLGFDKSYIRKLFIQRIKDLYNFFKEVTPEHPYNNKNVFIKFKDLREIDEDYATDEKISEIYPVHDFDVIRSALEKKYVQTTMGENYLLFQYNPTDLKYDKHEYVLQSMSFDKNYDLRTIKLSLLEKFAKNLEDCLVPEGALKYDI